MARPWDTKLTHELNEREMLDYIRHMESEDRFRAIEQVDDMVERCVTAWKSMRAHRSPTELDWFNHAPVIFHTGPTTGWYSELATVPVMEHKQIRINIYPWMDEKHVRYLARMQIEEQAA